ncbi:hypothetical protein O5559_28995, partial [Escherichia coli]|nr:hypothetical protein [Escherichia coli]
EEMRLRLARICGTAYVLAEHAAFRRQRPEFFDVVNRSALRGEGTPFPVQADFRSGNTRVAFDESRLRLTRYPSLASAT